MPHLHLRALPQLCLRLNTIMRIFQKEKLFQRYRHFQIRSYRPIHVISLFNVFINSVGITQFVSGSSIREYNNSQSNTGLISNELQVLLFLRRCYCKYSEHEFQRSAKVTIAKVINVKLHPFGTTVFDRIARKTPPEGYTLTMLRSFWAKGRQRLYTLPNISVKWIKQLRK